MATITKLNPSGSTNGAPVKTVAIVTPGTLFHTASATAQDEIYMFLTNTDTVAHTVTIEFGNATAPDSNINMSVQAKDTILALAGIPLTNSLTVKVFADLANKVNAFGYINRIA